MKNIQIHTALPPVWVRHSSMDEQKTRNTPGTPGKEPSDSRSECAECSGKLTTDDTRGEVYCLQCGCVAQDYLADYEHPANHAYDPAAGSNPGRGKLATGGAKLGTVDGLGIPLSRDKRRLYGRLGKIQQNLDRKKWSEETNRVVEKAMEMVRNKLPYPNEELIERCRSLLMGTLSSCRSSDSALFKSGSQWNAAAAALACMNQGSDKPALYRRIKEHARDRGLSSKQAKALRRRTMQVWALVSLHNPAYDGYKAKREPLPFVVPHEYSGSLPELFQPQIEDWLDRRRTSLQMARVKVPEVGDIDRCISKALGDPKAIGLSGGELLEPVLDAILLVLADEANPALSRAKIAEQAGLSSSTRKYTRRVHTLLAEDEG